MKHYIKYIAFTLLILVGASSCKTRKTKPKASLKTEETARVTKEKAIYDTKAQILEVVAKQGNTWQAVKVDWKAHIESKGRNLSSKVRMEVGRGKGVYLSIRPFPLIELARFWFLPKRIYIVNLMDKSYAELSYKQLSKELGVTLSYPQVEGLLTGQLVRLGHKRSHKLDELESAETCMGLALIDKQKSYIFHYDFSWEADLTYVGVMKANQKISWDNAEENHDFFGVFYKRGQADTQETLQIPQEEMFYFNKEHSKGLKLSLRKAELLDSTEDLKLQPNIKDSYRKIDLKELKFLFKYLLGKVK